MKELYPQQKKIKLLKIINSKFLLKLSYMFYTKNKNELEKTKIPILEKIKNIYDIQQN